MTYNVFSGTLNPTHFTSLDAMYSLTTAQRTWYWKHWFV